jgi:hypothetical protein
LTSYETVSFSMPPLFHFANQIRTLTHKILHMWYNVRYRVMMVAHEPHFTNRTLDGASSWRRNHRSSMMHNFNSVKTHNVPAINLLVHFKQQNKLLARRASQLLLRQSVTRNDLLLMLMLHLLTFRHGLLNTRNLSLLLEPCFLKYSSIQLDVYRKCP